MTETTHDEPQARLFGRRVFEVATAWPLPDAVPLTRRQRHALERLRRETERDRTGWEVSYSVDLSTGIIYVLITFGRCILTRYHRHIAIGPRGGMELLNARRSKRAKRAPRVRGWPSVLYTQTEY